MSGLVGNSRRHILSCRGSSVFKLIDHKDTVEACTATPAMKLENYRIVSHETMHDAYKNIYCARCNNVKDEDVVEWPIKIKCRKIYRKS